MLDIRRVRQREVLPLLLRRLTAQTAGVLNVSDLARRLDLDRTVVEDYVRLLEAVFVETFDGRVAAVEVKAGSQVRPPDLRGLRLLRNRLGDRFIAGVALHLGPLGYTAEDRIQVCPVDRLWS